MAPVVSKIFCSLHQTMLIIRKRPLVVNGGGFVVTNYTQRVLFTVDGCGTLGAEGQLLLRDGHGEPILFIRKKGGIVQALSVQNQWRGYLMDYEGVGNSVFSLREPKSYLTKNCKIKVSVEPKGKNSWEFEVQGSFAERACTIKDRRGNVVAQMGVQREIDAMASKDVYHVVVQPGYDQAFVVGIIAVLDNINGESTRC
ncbi:hypothetical protein Taro_051888 [Colocasia esculenta]|uniref:Protein LURP-one-related 6 n=1 Tax=Colocasia esculenta TaxID=4460 RepID=A0A843XH15_COLES|nr:hypothetical protein [Colocasia esculenta]